MVRGLMDRLVQAALVGTRRQPPEFEHPALQPQKSPERALLAAAAALGLSALAGREPARWEGQSRPCPADPRPPAGALCLRRLVEGEFPSLWTDWLERAAAVGRRCPERFLPELLELGRQRRDLRPAIARVAGARGAWLAARNPDWAYLTADSEDRDAWETGSRSLRQDWLRNLRQRDPAAARRQLEEVWESEPAALREAFLQVMETAVGPEDEPLLERALSDRSGGVRRVAAELLSCFDSRFRRQLPVPYASTGRGLEVYPPQECPDFLEPKPPPETGQRGWWLRQLVGLCPLPDPAVRLRAESSEWRQDLELGWVEACRRQRRVDWAEALLPRERGLFALLPASRREQLIGEALAQTLPLGRIVLHARPLSREVSQLFVSRLAGPFDFQRTQALLQAGLWLDPSVAPQVAALEPGEAVDKLANLLTFRQAIREELQP